MRTLVTILGSAMALLFLASSGAVAQGTALSKQEKARLQFEKLTESMQRLQIELVETAPDESKVLRVGNQYVQERQVESQMTVVRDLLKRGQWDEALEQMGEVRSHLDVLLNLLLNRDLDLKELLEEIARLEAFKERVEDLIDDQQARKEDAARSEALQEQLEAIEQAKAELDKLIQDQQALREQANEAGLQAAEGQAKEMSDLEGELKKTAESLAEELKDLEAKQEELTKPKDGEAGDPKAGDPKAGQPKSGKPKEGAPKDGKGGKGKPGACSGSCQGAAGAMGKAQQKLGQNQPERSLEDMYKALRKLAEAKQALEDMEEAARRELLALPFEQQAKKQVVTKIDTDKLAEDMEKAGEAKDGQPKKQTPGTDNVQQAVPKQKAAAGQLKEYKPGKAKQEQQDAKEDLEAAKKKLEDALAQLRQQLQDEVLRALEERFGAMLAKQKEITARTVVTDRLRAEALTADGGLPAALAKRCGDLSEGELGLASEAGDALKLLEEEGTTAVFPEIVIELKEDLERVAGRLGAHKTARVTQAMQSEVEDMLRMLIDALRRTIEENEGGRCGRCNGQPPLVPASAEVKLILGLQKRVAKRTKRYDTAVPNPTRATEEATAEAGEIARKQGRVKQLTRKLANKQNKEAEAQER